MDTAATSGLWLPECYDPREDRTVLFRKLPHWCQAGVLCFITWRLWDSMPAAVIRAWLAERDAWLRLNGVDPSKPGWESLVGTWPIQRQRSFRRYVSDRWMEHLDALHGRCVLRRPDCARVIAESLHYFDARTPHAPREGGGRTPHAPREAANRTPHAPREGIACGPNTVGHPHAEHPHAEREEYDAEREEYGAEREENEARYFLTDYVIMPNHVHILVAFPREDDMLKQCQSWKHYTASRINRLAGTRGRFWQQDAFDHLVRSPEEFKRLRTYIAANPAKSGLSPGEYLHYQKELPTHLPPYSSRSA